MLHEIVKRLLEGMTGERQDAGETAAFTRQLEFVIATTYDVKYVELKARKFVPINSSIPAGAESFVWRAWDMAGMAKIIDNFATDLPKVEIMGAEVVQGIKSIGSSYSYSIQDIRAAQMAGVPLDAKKAAAARRIIENKIDALIAKGDSAAGLPGFINSAGVPLLTTTELVGAWLAATSQEIYDDLNIIANTVVVNTKEVHRPDTLLLPTTRYSHLATKNFSATDTRSVLKVWLENQPYVRNVDQWSHLDTGDAAGTGPRAVCYARNPEVVEAVIPLDFEQLPPQPRGLSFETACHSRFGGVSVHYPLGMIYADDI